MVLIATLKKLTVCLLLAAGVGGGIYFAGKAHSEEERFNREDGSYLIRYYDTRNRRQVIEYDAAGNETDRYFQE